MEIWYKSDFIENKYVLIPNSSAILPFPKPTSFLVAGCGSQHILKPQPIRGKSWSSVCSLYRTKGIWGLQYPIPPKRLRFLSHTDSAVQIVWVCSARGLEMASYSASIKKEKDIELTDHKVTFEIKLIISVLPKKK